MAAAAPFAITYTGRTALPFPTHIPFPGIITGQSYAVTLVFDNGGSAASGQVWTGSHLTCVLFHINDSRNLVYAQDLVAQPPDATQGSAVTDANGALTAVFSTVLGASRPNAHYSTSGFTLTPGGAAWAANNVGHVFADDTSAFLDASPSGGIQMNPADWSAPQPFSAPCAAPRTASDVAPVPGLGLPALVLLGAGAAALGARHLRTRTTHSAAANG